MDPARTGPRPELVLVGGGHSHVQVLRRLLMEPLPLARVTLVVDRPVAVYSGMVPGFVAGQYAAEELSIDVRPLARRAGCRVIVARATRIDADARRIHLEGRPPIPYDLASVNVGSTVAGLDLPGVREHALASRPIHRFVERFDAAAKARAGRTRLVVVGAGAAGTELAFTAQQRLQDAGVEVQTTLVAGGRLLPRQDERVVARVRRALQVRGITLREDARVAAVEQGRLQLAGGEALPSDLCLWAAGAAATELLVDSGLPTDARGFVQVDRQLRVQGRPDLFAVGDCAVLEDWPEVPKAGVYAVRQGPVLDHNLRARLLGAPLRSYRPQRDFLALLNLGDGSAIGFKWGRTVEGAAAWRWKDRIDRRFVERFQVLDAAGDAPPFVRGLPPMPPMEAMPCGGCAAKVGATALSRALGRLPSTDDPEVELGVAEADDVSALRRGGELVIQTIDAFPAFVDDPWLVGRVAAANALSDLHAKGVTPRLALALVTVPEDDDAEEVLFQVLSGARSLLDAEGVTLAGGHSTVGPQLVVGFSVTAFAPEVARKGGLQEGDVLVLTRPLGTGVLFHADMGGRARGPWIDAALARMVRGNGPAGRVVAELGLRASTDITGFGFAGHLLEMLRGSGLAARVTLDDVPALDGALSLLERGERSTFHHQNARLGRAVRGGQGARRELLYDPQTAGGLLVGVPDDRLDATLQALGAAGEEPQVVGVACAPDEAGAVLTLA